MTEELQRANHTQQIMLEDLVPASLPQRNLNQSLYFRKLVFYSVNLFYGRTCITTFVSWSDYGR